MVRLKSFGCRLIVINFMVNPHIWIYIYIYSIEIKFSSTFKLLSFKFSNFNQYFIKNESSFGDTILVNDMFIPRSFLTGAI